MKRIIVPAVATITISQPTDTDAVLERLRDLVNFKHHGDKRIFNSCNPFYEKGDEEAEFFTEAYLYTLFEDKDAARTLLRSMTRLVEALGYTCDEVWA